MLAVIVKATGRLIEAQSDARPGTLIANAVAAGFEADEVEEVELTPAEVSAKTLEANYDSPAARRQRAIDALLAERAQDPDAPEAIKEYVGAK